MKIPLLFKNYLAIGLIGVTVGAVGYAQLDSSHQMLGAADGSWLNELNQLDQGKSIKKNSPKKKKGKGSNSNPKGDVEIANQSVPVNNPLQEGAIPAPQLDINEDEINGIRNELMRIANETLLDKPDENQCRQNHIVRNKTQVAVGEVRKAAIVPAGIEGITSCWVTILPRGCREMVEFKASPGPGDAVSNFCNAILSAGATGAEVIAIGSTAGPLGPLSQPALHSFEVYSRGQFARDLDQARGR